MYILFLLAFPVLVFFLNQKSYAGKYGVKTLAVINFFGMYVVLMVLVVSQNYYLDYQLNKFDLDGDGFFGGTEITKEQEEAMERVTNDTGRTFAPITGFIFCLLYFSIFYLVLVVKNWFRRFREVRT